MAQALTPGQVARTLSSFGSTGAGGVAGNMAQSLIDQGWDRLEEELRGNFFRTINLNWQPGYGGRENILQIDTVMSLWDQGNNSIFGQAGLQSRDGEGGLHVGLGYRARPVEAVLLGLNVFYDYLSDPKVSRYSLGAEAQTAYAGVSANWYQGMSDERLADGRTAYSPDGFDIEFSGRMPSLPYLELTGRYYRWNGQGVGTRDLEGTEYGLSLTPVPLFTVKGVYEDLSGGDDVGVEALIRYELGVPWQSQLSSSAVARRSDPWNRRFERVQRQYEQRVQYREAGSNSRLFSSRSAGDDTLSLSWLRRTDARSARLSWRQASTLGVNGASGVAVAAEVAAPRVENEEMTLDLTDARICPPSGTTCSYMITGLQTGTQYTVTLELYSGVSAGGTRLDNGSVTLMTSGVRGASVISVAATLSTITEGGPASTITLSASPAPDVRGGLLVPFTLVAGTGLMPDDYMLTYSAGSTAVSPVVVVSPVVIPAGETSVALTLTALTDTPTSPPEGPETLTLRLSDPLPAASYTLATEREVTVTMTNAGIPALSVAAAPGAIAEGATSTLTITASAAPVGNLTIPFTIGGTGITTGDYTLAGSTTSTGLTGTVTLPMGQRSVTLTLTAVDDADAAAEMLTVTLATGAGYTLTTSAVAVTINPLVTIPAVQFSAATRTVAETAGTVTVTVQLSQAATEQIIVPVMTANGTATAGEDYTMLSENVTFATGDTTQTISIAVTNDMAVEPDETFTVSLGTLPPNARAGTRNSVEITITSEDVPALSVAAAPTSIAEGAASTITITASAAPVGNLTIPFTIGGTGIAAADYTLTTGGATLTGLTGTVTLPASQRSVTLTLTAVDDADAAAEMLTVTLDTPASGAGYTLTTATATVTITPATPPVTATTVQFSAATMTVAEADGMVDLALELTVAASAQIIIPVVTTAGSATADSDYTAVASVTFDSGDTMQTLSIPILDDDLLESDETFTVSLGNTLPAGVTAGAQISTEITIESEDTATLTFDTATVSREEGVGSGVVTLQLSLTNPVGAATTVSVEVTAGGTATRGEDFQFPASATFDPGSRMTDFDVTILDDEVVEMDETFGITFSTPLPTGVSLGATDTVNVTITNDDMTAVSFSMASVTVPERDGEQASFFRGELNLSNPVATDVAIPVRTMDGTAMAGTHYRGFNASPIVSAGMLTGNFSIRITDDNVVNDDRTFMVGFGTLPTGVMLGTPATVTVTITNDDMAAVSFSMASATVAEDAGTVDVALELTVAASAQIIIPVVTTAGSATADSDYTAVTNVTFDSGDTMQTLSIPILDDDLLESDETFTVSLGSTLPAGVTAGAQNSTEITIESEDTATLTFDTATVSREEGVGSGVVTLQLSLTNPVGAATTVSVEVTAGGTATRGEDFQFPASATFDPGSRMTDFDVTILDDEVVEMDETFGITFSTPLPTGVSLGATDTVNVTITNDDTTAVSFSMASVTVPERNGSQASFLMGELNLTNPVATDVAIPVRTMDGTAMAGTHYRGFNASPIVSAGMLTANFSIRITDDNAANEDRTFMVGFGALPTGVTLGTPATLTVTIENDD